MFAAARDHKVAVEFLIARKANVNQLDKHGAGALHCAAFYGHKDVCEVLLKAGADKSIVFKGNNSAQCAAARGHKELAAFIDSWVQVRVSVCVSVNCIA